MKRVLKFKIPFPYIVGLIILSVGITFFITSFEYKKEIEIIKEETSTTSFCDYRIERMTGYKYIKPLMFVDGDCQSTQLKSVKNEVSKIINDYKLYKGVTEASFYMRDYNQITWTAVNEFEKYEPGSLFKVPILICFLKMSEMTPGFLNKKLTFSTPFNTQRTIAFKSKSIQLGQQYTIRELLEYMIIYSDNNATALLNQNISHSVLTLLFKDLSLEVPDMKATHYYFDVKQYSLFMRALYNASYLNIDNSEYAAKLLSHADFEQGIRRAIPKNIKMAHKFGESGTSEEKQLHESAIVYLNENPFLITIMTKGKDNKTLTNLIADISKAVYKKMKAKSEANRAI
jgi:beta-lactamase class A